MPSLAISRTPVFLQLCSKDFSSMRLGHTKLTRIFYKINDKLPPGTGCLCAAGSCCGFQMNHQTIQLLKQTEIFNKHRVLKI